MVLKKNLLYSFIFLYIHFFSFSLENGSFWKKTFQLAFINNPTIINIHKNYVSTLNKKKQDDYLWLPYFQFNINQKFLDTRGDSFNYLNKYLNYERIQIYSPNINFSFTKKLPKNGSISLSTGYGFNYLINQNAYLQIPQFQLTFEQNIGFKFLTLFNTPPERQIIINEVEKAKLIFINQLIIQFQAILNLIQQIDIINSEIKYLLSLTNQYDTEVKTTNEKYLKGLQSSLETHYITHKYMESLNELETLVLQKENILNEIKIIIPTFEETDIEKNRIHLDNMINKIYKNILIEEQTIAENNDSKIFNNMLIQEDLNYKIKEINYLPTLYVETILLPDSNTYSNYTDWYKSFRNLIDYPYPINFQTKIGIKINFETKKAKNLRKELYLAERKVIEKELISTNQKQINEYNVLIEQIDLCNKYLRTLSDELITEESFRKKRKKLLEEKLITQNDFFQGETLFFLMKKNYITNFWKSINSKLKIISLSSQNKNILTTFLGANYEEIF